MWSLVLTDDLLSALTRTLLSALLSVRHGGRVRGGGCVAGVRQCPPVLSFLSCCLLAIEAECPMSLREADTVYGSDLQNCVLLNCGLMC